MGHVSFNEPAQLFTSFSTFWHTGVPGSSGTARVPAQCQSLCPKPLVLTNVELYEVTNI